MFLEKCNIKASEHHQTLHVLYGNIACIILENMKNLTAAPCQEYESWF